MSFTPLNLYNTFRAVARTPRTDPPVPPSSARVRIRGLEIPRIDPPRRRRRRQQEMYGQGTLTRSKRTYGRRVKPGTNKYARIVTRATTQKTTWGCDNYGDYGGLTGEIRLSNWNFPGTAGPPAVAAAYYLPVHLWDITACPNNINGTFRGAQSGAELALTSPFSTAGLDWRNLGNPISRINVPHTAASTANVPNANSLLRGVSAKFLFYAPTTIPTRITISMIQILDPRYCPPKSSDGTVLDVGQSQTTGTTLPPGFSQEATVVAFWQSIAQAFAKNPVVHGNGNLTNKYMKIIKKHSFILNPKETTDNTSTTYHQYTFYHRFSRRMKYNWADDATLTNMQNDDGQMINSSDNKCCVEPRARYYLMVTGDSVYNAGEVEVASGAPTYDLSMRLYHEDAGS